MRPFFLLLSFFLFCSKSKYQKTEVKQISVQASKYLSHIQLSNFVKQTKGQVIKTTSFNEPFKKLQFNKVIAYDFDGDGEKYPTVIDKKTNLYNPIVLRQKELNIEQIENVVSFLTDSKTYGEGIAACFIPHFSIVFYQDNKMVFEVDVCLDCNYLESTIPIPAAYTMKMKLEDGAVIDLYGFSKTGKQNIILLSQKLGLGYGNYKI